MDIAVKTDEYTYSLMRRMGELLEPKKPEIIFEAMAYSVNAGGKRVRPILMLASCENECGDYKEALDFACAIEMIHTYSLIHDDLPAMDDDDFRRGKPTCHKKFGEAVAILAGDALLNTAFEIIINNCSRGMHFLKAASIIAKNAGVSGMIGGQTLDVISEGKDISFETLEFIHKNKTAALITASLLAGASIGMGKAERDASEERFVQYEKLGQYIGVAFQIKDDIFDVTSTDDVLGKPTLSDEKNKKATYVSVYSLQKAEEDYNILSNKAIEIAELLSGKNGFIYQYIKKLVDRTN